MLKIAVFKMTVVKMIVFCWKCLICKNTKAGKIGLNHNTKGKIVLKSTDSVWSSQEELTIITYYSNKKITFRMKTKLSLNY